MLKPRLERNRTLGCSLRSTMHYALRDRLAQLREVAEGIERKLLQSSGRGG